MLKLNQSLIESKDHLIIGVSGGIDSMVLLDSLRHLQSSLNLKLSVVHMNYHQRIDSTEDEALVKSYCETYDIPFFSFDYSMNKKGNFQQNAREERYLKYASVAKEQNAKKIVIAHQNDDLLETILMRLTRGSSLLGYAGILETSELKNSGLTVIRPLLNVSRADIEEYAKENNVPYREDSSNGEDHYTRNRFRHQVTPFLKQENPQVLSQASSFSKDIKEAYELIDELANQFITSSLQQNQDAYTVQIENFNQEKSIIQKDILKKIINIVSHNQDELSNKNIEEFYNVLNSTKPNIEKKLTQNVYLTKSYQLLTFSSSLPKMISYEINIEDFGTYELPFNQTLTISQIKRNNDSKSENIWYNSLDSIFPLTIRSRKERDSLNFSFGTKKLKDVYIDKKIPKRVREELPLVLYKKEIIYIPGIYKSDIVDELSITITYLKG